MAVGDLEFAEGAEEMGVSVVGTWMGGGGCADYGKVYTAVVQTVLLYRSELWVMSLWIGKALGGFNHQVITLELVKDVDITSPWGGDGGDGNTGDRNLRRPSPKTLLHNTL